MGNMKTFTIAVIAGDGIGQEVIPAGINVLKVAGEQSGFRLDFTEFPWGSEFYLRTGRMMDPDAVETLRGFDAIYFGAIGSPSVPDHITRARAAPPAAPAAAAVRQPATDAPAAGYHLAARRPHGGGHRHGLRARELRRRVLRDRRPAARRHAGRARRADRRLHPPRHRAHRPLRVRVRRVAPAKDARQRDEVERASALDGAVGRGRRGGCKAVSAGRVPQVLRGRDCRADGDAPAHARRHRGVQPVR